MDVDNIAFNRRLGVDKNLARFLAAAPHQEFVDEEVHQFRMARIAHGFVVDVRDAPLIGFAQCAQPARGLEGLLPQAARQSF